MGKTALFYHEKPIFGLDIGANSLKVMQVDVTKPKRAVLGYGAANFDAKAVKDGVIIAPEIMAKSIQELLARGIIGHISTRLVNVAIPAARTFMRSMTLPTLAAEDLSEAVRLEIEQYIPLPLNELYLDYSLIRRTDKEIELLAVAVPKKIIDSYLALMKQLDLEVLAIEPTITAASRLFVQLDKANIPTILIDFGAVSSDIIVYDKALIASGTVAGGGDNFTALIAQKLNISHQEAYFLKTEYGLGHGYKQKDIFAALGPLLEQIVQEIRRILRYYEEHFDAKKIDQIVTTGGGANMPGLNDYLTDTLRVPARSFEPWLELDFQSLQPPGTTDKSKYVTVAGLALLGQKEVFE